MHREARRSTRKRSNQVRGCRSRKFDFDILKKFGLRLRVYNVRIADASMQFLKTLESSSRIALKYLYITVKLAVTVKSRANRQQSKH